MDQLEQRVNEFFVNAKKNKPEWREEQMEVIKKVEDKRCNFHQAQIEHLPEIALQSQNRRLYLPVRGQIYVPIVHASCLV